MRGRAAVVCGLVLAGCRLNFDALPPDGVVDDGAVDSPLLDGESPPPGGCPSFAVFCDDFESGNTSRWDTTVLDGPATLVVSTMRARSGTFALEAQVGPDDQDAGEASLVRAIPPHSTGVLAARLWINLAAPLRYFNLVFDFRAQAGEYVTIGGDNNGNWVSTENDGTIAFDHLTTTPTPPLDTWTCVELVYSFTPSTRIQFYVNDGIVLDAPSVHDAPSLDEVRIGVTRADMLGFTVYVDDLAVATQRIGCE